MSYKNRINSVPKEVTEFLKALKLRLADKPYKENLPGFREPVWIIPVFDEKSEKVVKIVKGHPSLPPEEFRVRYELRDIVNIEGKEVKVLSPLPSVWEIFKDLENVRRFFRETRSIKMVLEAAKYATPELVFQIVAEEKLKEMGYRIYRRDEAPEDIKRVGSPDIIAEKDGKWLLAEVKILGQLTRYEEAKAKLILVTNVRRGRNIEIWGYEELENV